MFRSFNFQICLESSVSFSYILFLNDFWWLLNLSLKFSEAPMYTLGFAPDAAVEFPGAAAAVEGTAEGAMVGVGVLAAGASV